MSAPQCPFCASFAVERVGQWGGQIITAHWRCTECDSYFEAVREDFDDELAVEAESGSVARPEAFGFDPATLTLEPWPLEPGQIVSGDPKVSGVVIDVSPDGRVERGVWEHTPGVSRDVEADELFVVCGGSATIEVEGGPKLEIGPGSSAILRAGDRTVWRVHETLRKVYQVTKASA